MDSWQMYFFFNNAWTNAQSSGDVVGARNPGTAASAPTASRSSLPQGVRIVLTLGPPGAQGDGGRTITRDILVPPQLP
jgi:general secretion pathway protein J